jgi:hypothetical protein
MKIPLILAFAAMPALAQQQVVKPPIAVYWMSVETAAGMSIPGMPAGMPGMMGGRAQGGRRMLLQLGSQRASDAPRAEHDIPPALNMGSALPLITPERVRAERREGMPEGMERPKGRMLIYWGCGENTRPGQPVVLDFAKVAEGQMPPNMVARHVSAPLPPAPGRNRTYGEWPNKEDAKQVPEGASLRGEQLVKGSYSPEIRFGLDETHDFMTPVALASAPRGEGAASVSWNSIPNATGYFATVFGSTGGEEIVFWSASEVQEMGSQLMDYVPPAEVARLIREKVVLPPSTTECTVPAEVVKKAGGSPFLNFIAYGPEANFAQPPRPSDPKVAWEPLWTAKARFKSTATLILGEHAARERRARPETRPEREAAPQRETKEAAPSPALPNPVDEGVKALRGIFGR